jgi:hypothetical protein
MPKLSVFCRSSINRTLFLLFLFLPFCSQVFAEQVIRPSIWVKPAERAEVIRKINRTDWAKSLYLELGRRASSAAFDEPSDRRKYLEGLPLIWSGESGSAPTLPVFRTKGAGTNDQHKKVVDVLKDGVDCGVMYFLTQEEKYAKCGADILFTYINALKQMKVHKEGKQNSGWMYPTDHLYEARVIGAQLPVIYDFVYNYIKQGGKVYDIASKSLVEFNFDDAQQTFKTYIWLALNKGLYDSNWPVLESSSLVHNILALDDPAEITRQLVYYTHVDTKRQASVRKVAEKFENEGDIWPESFGYSKHVAAYSVYLMTLLDRYDPKLGLGSKHPNIPAAFQSYYDLQFPNGDYPFIGDGHRQYDVPYSSLEQSYLLAKINGNQKQQSFFGDYLAASIKSKQYKRGKLKRRRPYPAPYYTPTQLLWYDEEISATKAVDIARPRPTTKRLEFAGMNIQRNISSVNPIKNSLMAFIAGGSYIHGHASGMDMELYGQGYVLGIDGGKGTYRTDVHENYYRLFAAHNSVISHGASASKDGWINLGIDRVESVLSEPAANAQPVSKNHSVLRSRFTDTHNLVAPAEHQRTLALIRLSDTKGYYLDIFKAKSDYDSQFHDYVYHNIGDSVEVALDGKKAKLSKDKKRYQNSVDLPWKLQRKYRHPGWHFFDDVRTSGVSEGTFESTFTASKLGKKDIQMKAFIAGGYPTELTSVKAPAAYGAPKAYQKSSVPTILLRRQGEAWDRPFVVAYESITEGEDYAVQNVDILQMDNQFKGVKVSIKLGRKHLTQYIISQDKADDVYRDPALGLEFTGRFGLITLDKKQNVQELYIGDGSGLKIGEYVLNTKQANGSAYREF